jgi:transcriptional regulator GlxA family with amidase domain
MSKQIKIGVYIPSDTQLLDLACVDVFYMMSKEYISILPMVPKHMAAIAPSVSISYITVGAADKKDPIVQLTSFVNIVASHDISHPDVQPGKMDIILVPGPDPNAKFSEEVTDFLKKHAECPTTDILSVCTGIYLCGEAGILKGRTACGPRGLQDDLAKRYSGVKLVGTKYRWIQDGNFWSSGEWIYPSAL